MKDFWDQRYAEDGYAYGSEPNEFIKKQLPEFKPSGKLLFPAEGEGRNALFAAKTGWEVFAYDISETGKLKTENDAQKNQLHLDYRLAGFLDVTYPERSFDGLVMSYVHMPTDVKTLFWQRHLSFLKSGALIIFEGFSTENLSFKKSNPGIGGPDQVDMLYSVSELESYLKDKGTFKIWQEEVNLREGKYHNGRGSVIRCVGRLA